MKIAIVTGASSGLGREFVRQLEHFYNGLDEIWVIARRRECLEELQEEVAVPLRIMEGNLLERTVYIQLKRALAIEKPDVRMLVNAAGFGKIGAFEDIAQREKNVQLEMIDLNCIALTRMVLFCLPYLSRGSRIINLASAAAFCPQPGFAVYAATKSFVLSFSRGLCEELRPKGIYVTAVCPGPVETEFFDISGNLEVPLKQAVMAKPGPVVKQALLDSRAHKQVSVYGATMKGAEVASKLLPHRLAMRLISNE